jgi:arylsulfatase A-like enzyme
MIGKWHIGSCSILYTPVSRGFDSFYGFFYGEEDYYTHRVSFGRNKSSGLDFWNQTKDYLEPVLDQNGTYATFSYIQRAINIIKNHDKNKPLFLFYSAQNPHSDSSFNVPKEFEDKYKDLKINKFRSKILGMVSMLDYSINQIIASLKEENMMDNTIVFFTSDNGGEILDFQRNFPLRGGKSTVFEGGHRLRSFINSKNINAYTYRGMFHSVDWVPTVLSAAIGKSINIQGIDGIDQWDSIKNNLTSKRTNFIYSIDKYGSRHFTDLCNTSTESIRYGDWKLIKGCPGTIKSNSKLSSA